MTTSVPAASDGRLAGASATVEVDGRRFEVRVARPGAAVTSSSRGAATSGSAARRRRAPAKRRGRHADAGHRARGATVADGDEVEAGQVICIVEAMKMENEITAHRAGTVTELSVAPGQAVTTGQVICVVAQDGA